MVPEREVIENVIIAAILDITWVVINDVTQLLLAPLNIHCSILLLLAAAHVIYPYPGLTYENIIPGQSFSPLYPCGKLLLKGLFSFLKNLTGQNLLY